jgi:6-phosphofructokinase 1
MDTTSEFAVVRAPLPDPKDLAVTGLGPCQVPSPLDPRGTPFVDESRRVLTCSDTVELLPYLDSCTMPPAFEPAGARQKLFFDPATVTAGIVTCGGLCPGLNDVIRSVVMTLTYTYGVERILGFCYGYAGLARNPVEPPIELTPRDVEDAHQKGGSLLGSSRGPQDPAEMLDTLVARGVSVLFTIGGDGTLRGAAALAKEIEQRGLAIGVIGIPKTIDNDLAWTVRSFGFSTAVEEGRKAIEAAHSEARGARNGVGLVKLMGRHSGFIAAHASLANADVNFCLVPEVPFGLEGERGFLAALRKRLEEKHHAVVVVAEGAGQDLLEQAPAERDASGNIKLGDIGVLLRDEIRRHFHQHDIPVDVKYIDPSYIIRSLPANSMDSEFCLMLGQDAVHAGMAGRTNMVVGFWNRHFTHVPIPVAVATRKQLDPEGAIWQGVLKATGQPASMAG